MHSFRNYWYRYGLILALAVAAILFAFWQDLSTLQVILGISCISLFLHQFEEYQWPGYFPRMVNTVLFNSKKPDRYPLNANTAWLINVWFGWTIYFAAFCLGRSAIWLATVSIMVSVGNIFAHSLLFNLKGKSIYNPGMATALLLFLPISVYYFWLGAHEHLFTALNLTVGLLLGIAVNYGLVIKPITLLANHKTPYVFKPFN